MYNPLINLDKLKIEQPERFTSPFEGARYLNLKGLELESLEGVDEEKLNNLAKVMRAFVFASVEAAQSGHPGGSSGKVEQMLGILASGVFAFDPASPKHTGRDRMVWSAGHCTPGLYALNALVYEIMRRKGRQFSEATTHAVFPEDLINFRKSNGPQGHAESYTPFSDVSTGPSGHGLPAAGGIALAHKSSGLDTRVFVFMGDAESEEGITYEARNVLSSTNTDNIIVSLDYNHFGIDGPIEEVIASKYHNHWMGMGWNMIEVDGHNVLELAYAYRLAYQGFENNLPTVILAHTLKGKDYGSVENSNKSHGSPAPHDEYTEIIKNLGFDIPGEEGNVMKDLEVVLENIKQEDQDYFYNLLETCLKNVRKESESVSKMQKALDSRPLENPVSIKRPEILPEELNFKAGEKVATRKASQAFFEWLMKQTAFFYAGSGDLAGSTSVAKAEEVYGVINKDNPYGRGIRFGIAEQNMAMMSVAMTQDVLPGGYQPVSVFSTYAVFTSMVANCVRLGLIGNHLKPDTSGFFIMLAAHDGPETGEDGPTHQGLYWMSMFNAYPGIKVYKPMDANETIEMLFYALEKGEPIALSVMRPGTPVLDRGNGVPEAKEAINGAYVYKDFENNNKTKKTLVLSGLQTLLNTLEALPDLEKELDVKIVCVTSPELFEELQKNNPDKANSIYNAEDRDRAVIIHNGWKGFLYPFLLPEDYEKRTIGIDKYLKSGNLKEVYELAEFTASDLKTRILLTNHTNN